ncbi:DMT family transporter [Candidatus Formimonas warabiya]|uniref:DMT family transporter n=1 Tax=Formimonas warabiya TaxID=1761012 RepID=A0A3G1KMI4_FORW1|nr:DMT family transporter [Candidatus Formimonas warabiya]ATW23671.1 hypothetical protein DCMF_01655 [Candidatus Formimonas warabiya]
MGKYMALLLAGLIGIASGMQPSINTALGRYTGVKGASLVSFCVGVTAVFLLNLFSGNLNQLKGLTAAPWYLWLGGVLGAFMVYSSMYVLPKIGAAAMISVLLTFQLVTGMVIDHYGWLGTPVICLDWMRVVGAILLLIGVKLIVR